VRDEFSFSFPHHESLVASKTGLATFPPLLSIVITLSFCYKKKFKLFRVTFVDLSRPYDAFGKMVLVVESIVVDMEDLLLFLII